MLLTGAALDATFGSGGLVTTDINGQNEDARGIALEADGKIVAVGSTQSAAAGKDFVVMRYNSDGTLDSSFGSGGIVTVNFTSDYFGTTLNGEDQANAVAIDPEGRIVVAGTSGNVGGGSNIAVARFLSDGTLDSTFGSGGLLESPLVRFGNNQGDAVAITGSGAAEKILIGGSTSNAQTPSTTDFALVQYNADGSLDASFGNGSGWVRTDFAGGVDEAHAIAVQADGRIVLAGSANQASTKDDFALARYDTDGSLDTTFGAAADGKVTTDFTWTPYITNDDAYGVTIDSTGRIIAAGATNQGVTTGYDFAVARYKPDGTLDPSFDLDGKLHYDVGGGNDFAGPVMVTPDGKIIVAGESYSSATGFNFAMVRFYDNGFADGTFGTQGKLTTDFTGGRDQIYGISLDQQGRLVAAGSTVEGGTNYNFGLARYIINPSPTATLSIPASVVEGSTNNAPVALAYPTDPAQMGTPQNWFRFAFDFGNDGKFEVGDGTFAGSSQRNFTLIPEQYVDDAPGPLVVRARVIAEDGTYTDYVGSISITEAAPQANLGVTTGVAEGDAKYVVYSAPRHPSHADAAEGFRYAYSFTRDGVTVSYGDLTFAGSLTSQIEQFPPAMMDDGPGLITVHGWVIDAENQSTERTFTINVLNIVPTATLSAPASVYAGATSTRVSLDNPSDPSYADTAAGFHYAFSFTNGAASAVFGDGTYAGSSDLSSAIVPESVVDGGPGPIIVHAWIIDKDNGAQEHSTTITVIPVPPVAAVSGPTALVPGQSATFTLGATDVVPALQAAGFSYSIDWGDGSPLENITASPGDGAGTLAQHAYAAAGAYTVRVVAADANGLASDPATLAVNVVPAALEPDRFTPDQTDLYVGGTVGDDRIEVERAGHSTIAVELNGELLGRFTPTGRIVVYGNSGNDVIEVSKGVRLPAWLFGQDGNDVLLAGGGNSVLVGGAGNDTLVGGPARNLLVGGFGADSLISRGVDILVTGDLNFADLDAAINAIMAEWTSADDLAARETYLSGTAGGANGDVYLSAILGTVVNDSDQDVVRSDHRVWLFDDPAIDIKIHSAIGRGSVSGAMVAAPAKGDLIAE